MADDTNYYLLTRDKIDNLKAGTDSEEGTWLGITVGACLAIVGILIPLYVTGQTNTQLIPFMWATFLFCAGAAVRLFFKWQKFRTKREKQFNDILNKSKTIVTLASASQSKSPSQDSSQNEGSIPSS
jgi:hypothetical protein